MLSCLLLLLPQLWLLARVLAAVAFAAVAVAVVTVCVRALVVDSDNVGGERQQPPAGHNRPLSSSFFPPSMANSLEVTETGKRKQLIRCCHPHAR